MLHLMDRGAPCSGSTAGRWVLGLMGGWRLVMGTAWSPTSDCKSGASTGWKSGGECMFAKGDLE